MTDYFATMSFMLTHFWKPMLGIIVITSGCCYAVLNLLAWYRGSEVDYIDTDHYRRQR